MRNAVPTTSLRVITLIAMITCGCQPTDTGDTRRAPESKPLPAPTRTAMENGTYQGVQEQPVTLVGGNWLGDAFVEGGAARPAVGLVSNFYLAGDLNDDGGEEAVVLLWSNSGGSGTFDYLAVVGRDEKGAPLNLATTPLGDRVKIRDAGIEDGRIVVTVVQAGPEDPACCPGQKMKRSFALEDGTLTEVASEDLGRQSIADLGGVEWTLQQFDHDDAVPDGVEVTLAFDGNRVSGSGGCNRYNGSVVEGEVPGALTMDGPMASTRMACPPPADDVEIDYLRRMQGIRQYSFLNGKLALSWRIDDQESGTFGTMIFSESR